MRRLTAVAAITGALLLLCLPVMAHPLGNFTTNVHLGVHLEGSVVRLALVVDMAEIPTFREPLDADGDGSVSAVELDVYAATRCAAAAAELSAVAAGDRLPLTPRSALASLAPGQGDLSTLRLECEFRAALPHDAPVVEISNDVYAERTGWAEMVVTGGRAPGLGATSPTDVLRTYPDTVPPAQRSAIVTVGSSAAPAVAPSPSPSAPSGRVTRALAQVGATGGVMAVLAAMGLGVTHALAPGHGKTLTAAYLVGRRGTGRQAAALGLSVAVSHTIGVAVLGLVTAGASSAFRPEAVYPWLTTGSALIVTGLGLALLARSTRRRRRHHDHHDHNHHHDHDHPGPTWRSLAALGLAGGLVPSASAVVLLLGAVAIGRPWFGVTLVFAFGVGMAVALVGAGLVALRLSQAGMHRLRGRLALPARLAPVAAGLVVTTVGAVLLWDAATLVL